MLNYHVMLNIRLFINTTYPVGITLNHYELTLNLGKVTHVWLDMWLTIEIPFDKLSINGSMRNYKYDVYIIQTQQMLRQKVK